MLNRRSAVRNRRLPDVVQRYDAGLPDGFVKSASHVYILSDNELRTTGFSKSGPCPQGWLLKDIDVFTKRVGTHDLWVRRTFATAFQFWTSERVGIENDDDQTLAHILAPLPVLATSYDRAMWLAESCHPVAPNAIGHLRWIDEL